VGTPRDELLEFSIASLKVNANPLEIASHRQKIIKQGWDIFESQHRRKDGSVYNVLVSVQIDRKRNEFYGFIRDITEEKRAKELLEQINNRFTIAENVGNLGVWEWNIKTNRVFWSDNIFNIFGYKIDEVSPSQKPF
jgi:PAS domain-containing protein